MKTQILSRIQSCQNIQTSNSSSLKRIENTGPKCQNKKKSDTIQTSLHDSNKNLHLPYKLPCNRFFQSSAALNGINKTEHTRDQLNEKKVLNFNYKSMHKNRDKKTFIIQKKSSGVFTCIDRASQNSVKNQSNFNAGTLKDIKVNSLGHRNSYKSSLNKNRISYTLKAAQTITSIQNERPIQTSAVGNTPEKKQLSQTKAINYLMRTVDVFKDYRHSPYFALCSSSSKKSTLKSIVKNKPIRSLYRISTQSPLQKQLQVSIQLEDENPNKTQDIKQEIDFGCSQIQQQSIQNDSNFLDSSQQRTLQQLQQPKQSRKRVWKKLPNDFLHG